MSEPIVGVGGQVPCPPRPGWSVSLGRTVEVDRGRAVTSLWIGLAVVACAASSGCDLLGPPSRAPEAIGSIPGQELVVGDASAVELSGYFEDPDGDALAYEASTSDAGVARASVAGSVVTVEGVGEGTATATVAASAPSGLSAEQSFEVKVVSTRTVLAALYHLTNGPNWYHSVNWLTGAPLGEWYGVEVDGEGRVVQLRLGENNLSGPIPPELGSLSSLTGLWLNGNLLRDSIPPRLGGLTNLKSLWLEGNRLTGSIPPELGQLSKLEWLNLVGNVLTGGIPSELGALSSLTHLWLAGNELTGPIPPELGELSNLEVLQAGPRRLPYLILGVGGDNALTGPIPPELGKLSKLTVLNLRLNDLTGPIPPELGQLSNLRSLHLFRNELTGPIPPELGDLSNLRSLDLSFNELAGPIPPELGDLSNLRSLDLSFNELAGPIPPELGKLSQLRRLNLRSNALTGSIPSALGDLSDLAYLHLVGNELTGPIPPGLGQLTNLKELWLSFNRLSNPVPPELGDLADLQSLYLNDNELSGAVPQAFVRLGQLREFVWRSSFRDGTGLCVPGTAVFVRWLAGRRLKIWPSRGGGPLCNESDIAVLQSLHETATGAEWTHSGGWLADGALGEWYGVSADSLGRVTALDLSGNGLAGRLPAQLGELSEMRELRIGGNALSGPLPRSLVDLPLRELRYAGTELCAPNDEAFRAWLKSLPVHEGTGVECE